MFEISRLITTFTAFKDVQDSHRKLKNILFGKY